MLGSGCCTVLISTGTIFTGHGPSDDAADGHINAIGTVTA